MLLTRKLVKKYPVTAGFLTYPINRQPSHPNLWNSGYRLPLISTFLQARAYSSGHCPGFTPGSLLCPDLRQEIKDSITASNILAYIGSF
jgi:hypothetical protein